MANWSGTYTITTPGSTVTFATSTTMTNTSAVWPTGAQSLANFTVRILSGTGAGQERVITSNTSTVLTVPAWTTIPDATSTYELVLILKNNDHVTAALTLGTNIISELEDSATILVDGLYTISLTQTSVIRWNKSETTLVTFEANNRTIQGKVGFWSYITVAGAKTGTAPNISFIRIRDAAGGIVLTPSAAVGDGSTVHHIWGESLSGYIIYNTGSALVSNMRLSNFYCRNSSGGQIQVNAFNNAYTQTFERVWTDKCALAGPSWSGGAAAAALTWVRDSVFKETLPNRNVDTGAGKEFRISDCYVAGAPNSGCILLGATTAAAAGVYSGFHNQSTAGRTYYGANVVSTATIRMHSNDITAKDQNSFPGIDILNAATYTIATSGFDYIAGNAYACIENVDTSTGTTSTASPIQYKNLTSRSNAKSVPNFLLEADNVSSGTPTSNTATITFDCKNGAVAGQCTSVNADSAAAQPVLNVISSSEFLAGMLVEVGYGTPRQETGRVLSVGAGTITLDSNLTYAHTAAQGDLVKPKLRHWGLPFVKYGTSSGSYPMQSRLPAEEDWGLIFTGIRRTYGGVTYDWGKTGLSTTLSGLEPNTTYYAKACFITPFGTVGESTEFSFTTAGTAAYSDPGENNVRLGTTYQFGSPTPNRTGNARLPSAGDVKVGVVYDTLDTSTGTYTGADRWSDPGDANVRLGTTYKADSLTANKTGRVTEPTVAQVQIGATFGVDTTLTGTYDGSDRYTDVPTYNVVAGVNYRYNSTVIPNRMGTFTTPSTAQIAAAVWSQDLSLYATPNTAGFLVYRLFKKLGQAIGVLLSKF